MKLRTEMKDSGYGTIEPRLKLGDNGGAVFHDAACAHALMQAMREAGDGSADVAFYSDDDYQNWVYARADSLMREWGFDAREDA